MNDKKCWDAFSKFIRIRDAKPFTGEAKCITCPRIIHWTKGDAGHGIPRQHKSTKFHEQNNHLQCKHCNGFEGGVREVYEREVNRRYGKGTWDKLLLASRSVCKRTQWELNVMEAHYKREFERIKKEKNL